MTTTQRHDRLLLRLLTGLVACVWLLWLLPLPRVRPLITLWGMPILLSGLAVALWRWHRLEQHQHGLARLGEGRAQWLQALIEHSPLAIVVLSPQRQIQLINPAFESLFGWHSHEVEGKSLDALIATDDQSDEADRITQAVLARQSIHLITRRRRRDGSTVEVEVHGVPLMVDGTLDGIFALYQDITARHRAERRLKESEERLRLLSEATFEGLVITEGGIITDCNEQYTNILQRRRDALIGRSVEPFIAPADRERVCQLIETGHEGVYVHQILLPSGEEITVEVHARSIHSRGKLCRVAAVRDITDRRRNEEQLLQNRKMEAVGRLAGGIAHDFNNVLTVIAGYGQLLSIQVEQPELAAQVAEIRKATDHATAITQRLLSFSRKQSVHPAVHDLHATLQGVESMLRRLIPADIELCWKLDAEPLGVRADPSQLEQLVLNLAINAADAMPRGGRLTLATRPVDLTAKSFPPLDAGPHLELRVADTGSGMDAETRAHAFEPFFTTKDAGEGTGLGLATVYNIVHQNGGAIELDTAPGRGTVFRILFPRCELPDTERTVFEPASGGVQGEAVATVLVVEDEPGVRHLAARILELEGFEVLEAADGLFALELLSRRSDIGLLLTDVVMPGTSGPEVAARARQLDPEVGVLYMSGYSAEHLEKRFATPIGPLLEKPFTREALIARVHQTLALKVP